MTSAFKWFDKHVLDSDLADTFIGSMLILGGIIAVLVALIVGLIVAAVAVFSFLFPGTDRGECLTWHVETTYMPMVVGKVTTTTPVSSNQCDVWQYPNGKGE